MYYKKYGRKIYKDIFEVTSPNLDSDGYKNVIYIPHPQIRKPRKKQTIEEYRLKRRIYMKKYYTSKGLHLKKVGRPKQ